MAWMIDDIQIAPLVDADCFEIALNRIFPGADGDALQAHDWLEPDHVDRNRAMVKLGMHSFLIRTATLTILVDTCIGAHKERPAHPAWHRRATTSLLDDLARQGLGPTDIDLVFCTHLHADHIGWNTMLRDGRWVPTFPNARYALSAQELRHWQDRAAAAPGDVPVNHGSFADSVLPILDHGLAMPSGAGDSLAPGLTLISLPGHSPDHLGLELRQSGGKALFCGDAIHSPAQLVRPEWASAFCHDGTQAVATRRAMLDRAAEEDIMLFPAHFRGARAMRIRRDGEGYRPA